MPVTEALDFMERLTLTDTQQLIAAQILKEIRTRLGFLQLVGLQYLTLSRQAGTLSGGESQRIRLATQIGSSLMGVLYILDEPSIGLHQRDNDKLLATLASLRDLGNTLHGGGARRGHHARRRLHRGHRPRRRGPRRAGGGRRHAGGGHGHSRIHHRPVPVRREEDRRAGRPPDGQRAAPDGAGRAENNLKNIDVSIPLGTFTCVTGVSGSGKSSLVNEIIYKRLGADLNRMKARPGKHTAMEGRSIWTRSSTSTRAPSAAPPAPTPPPTPACSTTSGISLPPRRTPRPGATAPGASPSTPGAAGARPAPATAC